MIEMPGGLEAAIQRVRAHDPEPIIGHWCTVQDTRYPPKQVYAVLSGASRSSFTSHQALRALRNFGFDTSEWRTARGRGLRSSIAEPDFLTSSFVTLGRFFTDIELTSHLAAAETALAGADRGGAEQAVSDYLFSEDLLDAALMMRSRFGRISDIVHATVIARTLPHILAPGEVVQVRPSLAAGNSPDRPFDLEPDLRVAEFKVAQWKGNDTMRKRGVFADLAHLAADRSGRRAQLYVVGDRPKRFLTASNSSAYAQLTRSSASSRDQFVRQFGSTSMSVADFTAGPASHAEILDLTPLVPSLGAD